MKEHFLAGHDTHGTLYYLAPEMLIINGQFDHRVEAWSIGVILCQMLTS